MKFALRTNHELAIEIALIFIVPIVLFSLGILPLSLRFFVLTLFSLVVFLIILREKWTLYDLGIIRYNLFRGWWLYVFATLIALCGIILYGKALGLTALPTGMRGHLFLTFLPVSFFQEFVYRGFLMHALRKVYRDPLTIVLYNAALFTGLHVLYPYPGEMLPLAAVAGLFFATLYLKRPNLILVSLSHALLNLVAVSLGFFVIR